MGYFGVVRDAYSVGEWQAAVGFRPDMIALFENWGRQRTLSNQFTKAQQIGIERIMLTWEPWEPLPVGTPSSEQGKEQPRWSNDAIARGDHDAYINEFAVSIKDSGLPMVYIRLMHEMNGNWYPWHNDRGAYVAAWKRVRLQFIKRGVKNVRWVWAPNPNLYQDRPSWLHTVLDYWPGTNYTDMVGLTAINFGASRNYTVARFAERFSLAGTVFRKGMTIPEFNVAYELRQNWLNDLATYVGRRPNPPLHSVVLSQGKSRAAAVMDTGTLDWSVEHDDIGKAYIRRVADAIRKP